MSIPTTDWLTRGLSAEQIYKEKAEALEEVIKYFSWQPYPKKKPKEHGWYLITEPVCYDPSVRDYKVDILYWGKSWYCEEIDPKLKRKKAYWIGTDSEWGDYEDKDVIAWAHLPSPYIPKEERNGN